MRTRRVAVGCLLAAGLLLPCGCKELPGDEDERQGSAGGTAARPAAAGVTLSADALALSSVRVAVLQAATHTPVSRAFGQVVDTAPLFQAAAAAAARRAELEAAEAALAASSAELARVRVLHEQGENASRRALEAAQAAQRGDEARAAAARAQVDAGWSEVRQSWGPVITRWLQDPSPELQALADCRERLVLVTLTGGERAAAAPPEVTLEVGGRTLLAHLVSPAPRTDPALQGSSLYYLATGAGDALVAGLNVPVAVPGGEPQPGVLVPDAAVVHWSGVRWVYRQGAPGHFERVAVTDPQAVEGGLFVASGLAAGDAIAVAGAAVLLSQELTDLGLAPPGGEG
jgi:hypothetical protein